MLKKLFSNFSKKKKNFHNNLFFEVRVRCKQVYDNLKKIVKFLFEEMYGETFQLENMG